MLFLNFYDPNALHFWLLTWQEYILSRFREGPEIAGTTNLHSGSRRAPPPISNNKIH